MPRKNFDHLLGEEKPDAVENKLRQSLDDRRMDDGVSYHLQDVLRGVPVSWLANVFGMDPHTVKKRLADCPPVDRKKSGYRYNVAQAASYLIKPVFDEDKFMRTMKPTELPPRLQSEFWTAMEKRIKYKIAAGELWHTEDVLDAFGQIFILIKTSIQLWPDNVARELKLDTKQRQVLTNSADALQRELYEQLLEMNGADEQTFPLIEEEDEIIGDE